MPTPKPLEFYVIIPDPTQLEPLCPQQNNWNPTKTRIDLIVQGCNVIFQCETINGTLVIRSSNPKYICEALAQEGVVHMVCYEETQAKNITTDVDKYSTLVSITKDLRTELEATRAQLETKITDYEELHDQFVALTIKHKALKTENEKLLQSLAAPSITGKAEWPRIRMENRNEPSTRDCAKTMKAQAAMITLRSEVSELTKENNTFRASLISLCTANKELADALLMAYTK